MKIKNLTLGFLIFFLLLYTLSVKVTTASTTASSASGVIVTRDLPTSAICNKSVEVTLQVNVDEANPPNGIIIVENIPSGWNITSATPNYYSQPSDEQYKWLFSVLSGDVKDTTINYTLSIPSNATAGNVTFSGTVETSSGINNITGDTEIAVLEEIANVEVTREMPTSASIGSSFDVNLIVDVNETNLPSGVIVVENIPSGWSITSATPSYSSFNASKNQCKWLFYSNIADTTITYSISIPSDATAGNVSFSGTVETASTGGDITGDLEITITEVPGDSDGDGDVGDMELLGFIEEWSQGTASDADLLQAIENWAT